jgi:hypothetical protein
MAITQPSAVADLVPGDIILVVKPGDSVATLQQVIAQQEDTALLPPEPGNIFVSSVDAVAPVGTPINRMQLLEAGEVPQVVYQVPRLGGWLPVLATTAGFAGVMVLLGLFATILVMRVLLSTGNTQTRKSPARIEA